MPAQNVLTKLIMLQDWEMLDLVMSDRVLTVNLMH